MLLLWFLCLPWVLSAADRCALSDSSHTASPILESLQCYNDYLSYFHCKWREEPERQSNGRLKLWLKTKYGGAGLCEEYASDEEGFSQCRYKTKQFSSATTYTAFFKETVSLCSTGQTTSRDLSILLRARAPVNLTTSSTGDGGRLITWASPYPQSSPVNNNITFQLSYRPEDHNNWTSEELSDNHKKLEKKRLIPGHRYEARVRARVRMGQWSHWSSLVFWHSQRDVDTAPPVDCVLWGEQEVQCRWEQSIELVHFISFQLVCRGNHTAPLEVCCEEPAVSLEHREDSVRFSCLLNLTQPSTSSLQVALVPTRSTKMFHSSKHIRPPPPTHVTVTDRGNSWIVAWTPPQMRFSEFDHEICYYSQKMAEVNNVCSDSQLVAQSSKQDIGILPIPKGSSSCTLDCRSLLPSHRYQVKVRTRVMSPYEGTPSDWSAPAEWTSHAEVWPISYWIYSSVAALVTGVFLTLFIVPVCRRKTLLWVESVPSPGKSKALLDIQTVKKHEVILSESIYHCKVLHMDSFSTCSSDVCLWSTKSPDSRQVENAKEEEEKAVDDGIWSCDNLPVSPLDKSAMSFTGPYILCQGVESIPGGDISEVSSCPDVGRLATVRTFSFEEGYVCLPSHTMCRSVQDLTSQSHGSTEEELSNSSAEEDHICLNEDCASDTFWPQGGAIQDSGYCQLPTDLSSTQLLCLNSRSACSEGYI